MKYEYRYALSGPNNDLAPINALAQDGWEVVVPMRPVEMKNDETGETAGAIEFLVRKATSVIAVRR